MFDVEQQAAQAKQEDIGTEVVIHGVDEMPSAGPGEDPVTITMAGAHSSIYRDTERAMRKRKLKPKQMTGSAIYDDNIDKAVACTLGWSGFVVNGEALEFTPHNVRMVYKRCPWVYEQVFEVMHDHSQFFGNASSQPASTSSSAQG